MTVVRHQFFPQKHPGSSLRFSRTGVQPSPGSSTIELPSAFPESGAYSPDRALPGSPRQCSLPFACRHTSRKAPNWGSEEARTWEHHPQPTIPPPRLNRQAESRRQPVGRYIKSRVTIFCINSGKYIYLESGGSYPSLHSSEVRKLNTSPVEPLTRRPKVQSSKG